MDYSQEVVDYIVHNGDLTVALEVSDILNAWTKKTQKRFWRLLADNLNHRLASTTHLDWKVNYNKSLSKANTEWFACGFTPLNLVPGQQFFGAHVQQGHAHDQFPLKYGLVRSHPNKRVQEDNVNQVDVLQRQLLAKVFSDKDSWWLGVKGIDHYALTSPEFLQRMAQDEDAVVNEIATLMWEFFMNHLQLITEAHKALAEVKLASP